MPLPLGGSGSWFFWPTRVYLPMDISIGSAVFARLTNVTSRQTDHLTPSVAMRRIWLLLRCGLKPKRDESGFCTDHPRCRRAMRFARVIIYIHLYFTEEAAVNKWNRSINTNSTHTDSFWSFSHVLSTFSEHFPISSYQI